jgi:hypothetical protein
MQNEVYIYLQLFREKRMKKFIGNKEIQGAKKYLELRRINDFMVEKPT